MDCKDARCNLGTLRVPCPGISQLEGPGVQVLLQEEQGCPRARFSQQEAPEGWGRGAGCWASTSGEETGSPKAECSRSLGSTVTR